MGDRKWWSDYDNIILLTRYLADRGDPAEEVAYAVEKPWKYEEEFESARTELRDG
jgi:hypothetical protein